MNIFDRLYLSLMGVNFKMGSLESPQDSRNVEISRIQKPVTLPVSYETMLPPVENQGGKPKCVGSAIHKIAELYLSKDGNFIDLSDDDLYEQCKEIDGIPDLEGTYPSVGAKVVTKYGVASKQAYDSGVEDLIVKSRALNKLSGYAFVEADYNAICQAIYQNMAITASFDVGFDWFSGKITKVLRSLGRHYVVLHGFDYAKTSLLAQNSWGSAWIGYIAGIINPSVKMGQMELSWDDVKNNIYDIIAFTKIEPKILEEIKDKEYKFMITLKFGSKGYEVQKLQERLIKEGFLSGKADGFFGNMTKKAVIAYQTTKGLQADGIVGQGTRAELNRKSQSSLHLWAKAIEHHEGYFKGSRSYRNNNPANFKSGTLTPFMKSLGAIGVDSGGFCIFPSYEIGFKALCSFLEKASTNKLTSYRGHMTLFEFFSKYAPQSENDTMNYAKTVAKKIGCSIDTQIKELV